MFGWLYRHEPILIHSSYNCVTPAIDYSRTPLYRSDIVCLHLISLICNRWHKKSSIKVAYSGFVVFERSKPSTFMSTLVWFRGKTLILVPEIKVAITRIVVHMNNQGSSVKRIIIKGTLADSQFAVLLVTFICLACWPIGNTELKMAAMWIIIWLSFAFWFELKISN